MEDATGQCEISATTFRERSVCDRGYTGGSQADRCSYVIVETEVNKASSKWLQKTDDASGEDEKDKERNDFIVKDLLHRKKIVS